MTNRLPVWQAGQVSVSAGVASVGVGSGRGRCAVGLAPSTKARGLALCPQSRHWVHPLSSEIFPHTSRRLEPQVGQRSIVSQPRFIDVSTWSASHPKTL